MTRDELPADTLVAFSRGEYSDYSVDSFAKLLKPISAKVWDDMNAVCLSPSEYNPGHMYFDNSKAVPWLVANGFIEEIEYTELHLGSYGSSTSWEDA